jgi:hypothetical protein
MNVFPYKSEKASSEVQWTKLVEAKYIFKSYILRFKMYENYYCIARYRLFINI